MPMASEFDANLESARHLTGSGAHQQALRLLDRMVETFPERYEAYELRSSVNRKMGNLKASIGDLDRVIRLIPDSAAPDFRKGRYLCAMHLFGHAVHEFTKAIELDNGYFGEALYFSRAEARLRSGDYRRALSDCKYVAPDYTQRYSLDHPSRSRIEIENEAMLALSKLESDPD